MSPQVARLPVLFGFHISVPVYKLPPPRKTWLMVRLPSLISLSLQDYSLVLLWSNILKVVSYILSNFLVIYTRNIILGSFTPS